MADITTVKSTIEETLTGDPTYIDLMGNPDSPYNTFYRRPPEKPSFPEVVWWLYPESFSGSDDAILNSIVLVNFNAWSLDKSGLDVTYDDIIERIQFLLHNKPLASVGVRLVLSGTPIELFDEDFKVPGKNITFNMYYRRSTI